jgi:serine/threonine-protein kinase
MWLSQIHQYQLHHRLGSGSQGTVYYATDTRLMRPVVLKIVRKDRASDPDVRRKILQEARLASAIQHPNVCAIYEAGEYDNRPYIVMQYVPGQTLQKLLASGPLNMHFSLSIGIQIASGLADAHRLKILHRDLKPANIMITDGGLVKILDFGLAKRRTIPAGADPAGAGERGSGDAQSSRFGTTAYMAPEQFVTRRSSDQSDGYALGVILYEMITGQHPFWTPGAAPERLVHAIQFSSPVPPRETRPEIPEALEGVVLRAIDKQPANRFSSASELCEALKTLMKTMEFELGMIPGESSAVLPSAVPDTGRRAGPLSLLVERFLPKGTEGIPENSIAVLPFQNLGTDDQPRYYGLALADMVATRLAGISSAIVRPPSAFLSLAGTTSDAIEAARRLKARYGLSGSFVRSEDGFTVHWQLSSVAEKTVLSGGTVSVPSLDLVKIQSEISEEVVAALYNIGIVQQRKPPAAARALPEQVSEEYLKARALLSRFLWSSSNREDLEQARQAFESVLKGTPAFAPAEAGLGMTHLHYVINGFGGLTHFTAAQRHLENALAIDPDHVEARLNRAYTFLWRGEKENARHDIQYLLRHAGTDGEVLFGAGVILQLDGLPEESLRLLGMALQANPTGATRVYNRRARSYHYMGQLDLAWHEVEKGLTLEPNHLLLRTTQGYLLFREGQYDKAIGVLSRVIADDPGRRLTYPTLAMCYAVTGQPEKASALITDELLAAAAADCEMAYRLATYCVVDGNVPEALHWLRRAIYLGNENYLWLSQNPVWAGLHGNAEFDRILADMKQTYQKNRGRWKKFLAELFA